MVPLCSECHGKVHDCRRVALSSLIKEGLERARVRGKILGRPKRIDDIKARELRTSGHSLRQIAEQLNTTKSGVQHALRKVEA